MPGSNMPGSNTSDLIRHSNITVDNLLLSGISIYSNHSYIDTSKPEIYAAYYPK